MSSDNHDGLWKLVRNAAMVRRFARNSRKPPGPWLLGGFRNSGSFHRRDQMGDYPPGVAGSRR